MSTAYYVGIDPGLTGAVTVLSIEGEVVEFFDAPVVEVIKGGSKRSEPDVAMMARLLGKATDGRAVRRVVLEKVQPMPRFGRQGLKAAQDAKGADEGWGATPNFSLGLGYGLWWALVVAAALPLERVSPATWRARLLAGLPAGKEVSRQRAIELFPAHADNLRLKKHHGRSDSLLLAEYGRRLVWS